MQVILFTSFQSTLHQCQCTFACSETTSGTCLPTPIVVLPQCAPKMPLLPDQGYRTSSHGALTSQKGKRRSRMELNLDCREDGPAVEFFPHSKIGNGATAKECLRGSLSDRDPFLRLLLCFGVKTVYPCFITSYDVPNSI